MFPPMTPMGERKRYETELEVLEREAIWHAELERQQNHISLFERIAEAWARLRCQLQTAWEARGGSDARVTSGC